jgi:hypothetical protein
MKRFFRRLFTQLVRDDLFVRVVCFLAGLLFGGLGVATSIWVATHHLSPAIQVLCWTFAILFTVWGALLFPRCVLSAHSRMARFIDRYLPDAAGFEDAALLVLAIYLPAALLTLLLRFLSVRGQRTSSMAFVTPRSQLPRPPT